MNRRTTFPHQVRETENVWIAMPDGCRLSARLWLPEVATRVPAVLEWIPYRKRDATRERDETMHRWFAGHGYAALRVDVRGTGDSEGVLEDEYSAAERADAEATIAWIASQPWCDGAVGMIGKSWGGIAALQAAARRPPALRAVVAVCATDDRFATDAHWMGGCLLGENLAWGASLLAVAAEPPDPQVAGSAWRSMWQERLGRLPHFPEIWMRHPSHDAYWRAGSVAEDYARITCPVLAVSGWADAYVDAVFRLLAELPGPRLGIVGPWAHVYPHEGIPGPAIGFLQEAKRWWDRWLRGIDTGIDAEPMLRAWMPGAPGRWVMERSWPSASIATEEWRLATGENQVPGPLVLQAAGDHSAHLAHRSPQTVGLSSGPWCPFGNEPDLASDSRADDAASLVFESAPLARGAEILGRAVVTLALSVDRPAAFVVARLCDVSPDGTAKRVAYGVLDLARRSGGEKALPVVPGEPYRLHVGLHHAAHAFLPGHRIRLALSTAWWPILWPPPEPVTLGLDPSGSSVELPRRPSRGEEDRLRPFESPEGAMSEQHVDLHLGGCCTETEIEEGTVVHRRWYDADLRGDPALTRIPSLDLEFGHGIQETYRIAAEDPLRAEAVVQHRTHHRRGDWLVRIEVRSRLTANRTEHRLETDLVAREGERVVATRRWEAIVPRARG